MRFEILHIVFTGKTSVGGQDGIIGKDILAQSQSLIANFDGLYHWFEGMLFLTSTKGLGINDDLVFLIHRRYPVVTLYRALAGGHPG